MLTKEGKNKNNCIKRRYYYDSARSAFIDILKKINLKQDEFILFPSYIGQSPIEGSGVFDPVRLLKVPYCFYKINLDLSVDFEDIKSIVKESKIKVLFLIHYFGFPQKDTIKIADFCRNNNIIMIEDCAHSISSTYNGRQIGSFGDYALFSVHKICASATGGFLQVNNSNEEFKLCDMNKNDFLQFINTDFDLISKKRRENYLYYLKKLENTDLYTIFYKELPENVVPLNFPVLINKMDRYELYKKLIAIDVPCVSLWHTLIEEIDRNKYLISKEISRKILNLPLHQDITTKDIDYIIENFVKELKK